MTNEIQNSGLQYKILQPRTLYTREEIKLNTKED